MAASLDDLRTRGEAEIRDILAGLDRRHRARVQSAVEQYGRVQDIPQSFWGELQREIEDEEAAAVLLLMLAADEWTSEQIGVESQPDQAGYALLAARQVQASAEQTIGTLRDRLARKVEDQRTVGPGAVGELTGNGLGQALDEVFTQERRAGIAADATTSAFSQGQLGARDRIVGDDGAATVGGQRVTIEMVWETERDDRVCPRCSPLQGTTEDVWGRVFPNGPGPEAHPNCRCELRPRVVVSVGESLIREHLPGEHDQDTHGRHGGGGVQLRSPLRSKKNVPSQKKDTERSIRAKRAYNPSTKKKQDASESLETTVAKSLGGVKSGDNLPMDVTARNGMVGLEIKMVHDGKDDKVHMRRDSRQRKEAWVAEKRGRRAFTVIIDNRDRFEGGKHKSKYSGNRIYWKEGVGAFRFAGMNTAKTLSGLKKAIGL